MPTDDTETCTECGDEYEPCDESAEEWRDCVFYTACADCVEARRPDITPVRTYNGWEVH